MTTPFPELYCEIRLTLGQVALVDVEDYERLNAYSWQAVWNENNKSYYAKRRGVKSDGHHRKLSMSREVMGLKFDDGLFADHENHNTLDNRKANLRVSTRLQNASNRNRNRNNKTGFKGVHFNKAMRKFQAYIRVNTKLIHLGFHETAENAHAAYCAAARKHHGEFAQTA